MIRLAVKLIKIIDKIINAPKLFVENLISQSKTTDQLLTGTRCLNQIGAGLKFKGDLRAKTAYSTVAQMVVSSELLQSLKHVDTPLQN